MWRTDLWWRTALRRTFRGQCAKVDVGRTGAVAILRMPWPSFLAVGRIGSFLARKSKFPMYRIICTGRKSLDLSQTSTTGHRTTSVRPRNIRTDAVQLWDDISGLSNHRYQHDFQDNRTSILQCPCESLTRPQPTMCKIRTCISRLLSDCRSTAARRPYDYPAVPLQLTHGCIAIGVENTSKGTPRAPPKI